MSPLHDFEESVKGFVDFFVLFAFGAVNAGVDVGEIADMPWQMREFAVLDPSGNRLRIGHNLE